MQKIAIIGAGQAGLYLAISLLEAGYKVTLFAERSPEAVLNSKPMAIPVLFEDALQLEAKVGLDLWAEKAPKFEKVYTYLSDPEGNLALIVSDNLEQGWQAIDQRLKFSVWMQEFVNRGGELIIQEMKLKELEECALKYDLVVVAAGKGSISQIFKRDAEKSTHEQAERYLAACIVKGLKRNEDDLLTHKVTLIPGIGEILQMPFYHKNQQLTYVVGFEVVPNGVLDQFRQLQNGQEVLELSKQLIQKHTPWIAEGIEEIELADEQAWLMGAITPVVRSPIGYLSNGAIVMGIADAVILNDPLAAQGANNATKMANFVKQKIVERGNCGFDADWMQAIFDEFWQYSQYVNALTDCMLTPPAHLPDIMVAAAENKQVAKDFFNGFNHPPSLFPWFGDGEAAKKYLEQKNSKLVTA